MYDGSGEHSGDFDPLKCDGGNGDTGLSPLTFGSPLTSSGRGFRHQSSTQSLDDFDNSSFLRQSRQNSYLEEFGNTSAFNSDSILNSTQLGSELESMDASELRRNLLQFIDENTSLKSEILEKSRQIRKVKSQVQALIDLESSSGIAEELPEVRLTFPKSIREGEPVSTPQPGEICSGNEIVVRDDQLDFDDDNVQILPRSTLIFIREMTSRMEMDQGAIRERMLDGIHVTNQVVLGGLAGWTAAYLLKNFGKMAVTSLGGGALLLGFATRKGYVHVKWAEIYEELQRQSEASLLSDSSTGKNDGTSETPEDEEETDWTTEKVRNFKSWISDHSITVAGFICGFFYKLI